MNKKLLIAIDAIISIILITAIFYFMDLGRIWAVLSGTNLFLLAASILFLFVMYAVMITRIHLLLDETNAHAAWSAIAKSHWVGMLLADFTPARSGYFATAAMLHYKYKVPSEKALISIFGPQMFDFAVKVIAGTAGIMFILWNLLDGTQGPLLFAGSGVMTIGVAVMLLLLFSKRFLDIFAFAKRLPIIGRAYCVFEKMQENSHAVIKKTPHLIILLLISWTAKAISWYFVAKSVGITVPFPYHEVLFYFMFQPLVTILEFIPLPTIAGAGASEAAGVFIMLLFNVPKELSFSFMLLARVKTIFVNLIAIPDALKVAKSAAKDLF